MGSTLGRRCRGPTQSRRRATLERERRTRCARRAKASERWTRNVETEVGSVATSGGPVNPWLTARGGAKPRRGGPPALHQTGASQRLVEPLARHRQRSRRRRDVAVMRLERALERASLAGETLAAQSGIRETLRRLPAPARCPRGRTRRCAHPARAMRPRRGTASRACRTLPGQRDACRRSAASGVSPTSPRPRASSCASAATS